MANKKEIEFSIDKDGNISFEVKGIKGPDCLEETKDIEEALGKVTDREKTSEFYQEDVSTERELEQNWGS